MSDISEIVKLQEKSAEEFIKVESILKSILPGKLVGRKMSGDKIIAMTIQSVSFVFIDVVNFESICDSIPPQALISTVNSFFKMIEELMKGFPLLTKVNCIGDSFLAGGGIFMDINQPNLHGTEAVNFGLEVISSMGSLEKKMQVRVGVHIGGPVTGGIIETSRPTFKLIGRDVNIAQQIQRVGTPMQVQITRAVYELIYGGTFSIKECGAIDIKGGTVLTYIVTKKSP
jgi:class 3 adenylate cyclase